MSSTARIGGAVRRTLEAILGPRIDRCALYPARVVAQAADGTLEVVLDDPRWASMTRIPIRTPVPNASVKVQPGARVLIGWEPERAGQPPLPYASLWESGTLTELVIDASVKVRLSAPTIEIDGATSVLLAGGGQPVARLGDTVTAGPYSGSITGGSTKVTSG